MLKIKEIEIGPHFLTVYGHSFRDMLELSSEAYRSFLSQGPEQEYLDWIDRVRNDT